MPIACPHYDLDIVGRSKTHRSAVASAAYQSGDKLYDEYQQKQKVYPSRNERIIMTEILLPKNAPPEFTDRNTLWNSAQNVEKRKDAQYARRFVMALPRELSDEENIAFIKQYCQEQFVSQGMVADIAFHHDGDGNPHAHVLTTMRPLAENGKWAPKSRLEYVLDKDGNRIRLPSGNWKTRKVTTVDWDNQGNLEMWRHEWEVLQNKFLEKAGCSERIDMRSYERQGNDLVPTVHLGPAASAMERRGIRTFLGDLNREIKEHNRLVLIIKRGLTKLKEWADNRQERKQMREAEKAALGPPIRSVLAEFIWQRQSGRKDWYSKDAKLKWFAKDVADIRTVIDWLEKRGIYYTADYIQTLGALESRYKAASEIVRKNDDRRKQIDKICTSAETYERTKPIFDAYNKIFFSKRKQAYADEHADELKDNKRAYAYLMNHHDEKLQVQPHEFDAELKRMVSENEKANAELTAVKADLDMLHKVKYYIVKIDPELIGEKPSLREQIAKSQEHIRQQDAERKNQNAMQHEQKR